MEKKKRENGGDKMVFPTELYYEYGMMPAPTPNKGTETTVPNPSVQQLLGPYQSPSSAPNIHILDSPGHEKR